MGTIVPFLEKSKHHPPRTIIFLSGSGSNAEKILAEQRSEYPNPSFHVVALFTDAPAESRARELAEKYEIPYLENDIRKFYRTRGLKSLRMASEAGRTAREEWTNEIRQQIAPYQPDFGVLAGFARLTNITADFPCLNVHPGDLTYVKDNSRYLTGLHTLPIEKAILEGLDYLRSSVIIAQSYKDSGTGMDSGPILGISEKVPIELAGSSLEALHECAQKRPPKKPKEGYGDRLEKIAKKHLKKLKERGDWVVFPQVVKDFARARFGFDVETGKDFLWYRQNDKWQPVHTVIYGQRNKELLFRKPYLSNS
ncbi:MAG: formyltransferase family protein [Lentisphaeria bacterium]